MPDELRRELVVSCLVTRDGAAAPEKIVRDVAKAQLASCRVPRRVLFLTGADLSTTGSAQVKTAALRRTAAERIAANG